MVKDFSKIDWCKYILNYLVSRKQLWRRDDKTWYYSAPILILTLVYVYNMKFTGLKIVKRQLLENFENIDGDEEMVDGYEMSDGLMRLYGDEDAYIVVIEHNYGIILCEKKNIEKALKNGIVKFPDSLMLKELIVKIGNKVKKDEMALYNSVFASKRDYGEEIWNIGSGHVLHQGFAYHFKSNTFIHVIMIDCCSSLLNKMEELRDVGLVSRIFFDTNFLAEEILGGSMSSDRTQKLFDSMLILHLKSLPKPENLKDIGQVFFPIVNKSKYYLICFDLRVPTYYIIDHVNQNGAVEDIYGTKHVRVV
ncbi:unnamed protein product [Lactuca saligna]|uniref:Uncharacterized protein n=1 Tax=Lactuca saligna TaxID=75948 RepID=A0AA35ZWB5_LACSI|nr:unnamed protein product [Lactuca saligna]